MLSSPLDIRFCQTDNDKEDLLTIRHNVYVKDQGLLSKDLDMSNTFDKYNDQSIYLLGYLKGLPIAAIKVIQDGPLGLPAEFNCNLASLRNIGNVVEFGHLITERKYRSSGYATLMMKAALDFAHDIFRAKYIIGDFFVNNTSANGLHPFYQQIGFIPISDFYTDNRFVDSPPSIVGKLDINKCIEDIASKKCRNEIKHFFFADLKR